jgi:hypothetical protein
VVGRRRGAATRRAVAWLRANQNDDGGFGQFRGRPSNSQSTAYAVQGLVAAGAGGASLTRALAYLRGLQRSDGSISYSSTSNQTPVWVTAQALMALEREPLPIAALPRRQRRHKPKPAVAPAAAPKAKKPKPHRSQTADPSPDVATSGRLVPTPRKDPGLAVDRTNGSNEGSSGVPGWVLLVAVGAVLAALVLLRRRLIPHRFRRGPAPS